MFYDLGSTPHILLLPVFREIAQRVETGPNAKSVKRLAKALFNKGEDWPDTLAAFVKGPLYGKYEFPDADIAMAQRSTCKFFVGNHVDGGKGVQLEVAIGAIGRFYRDYIWANDIRNVGVTITDDDIGSAEDFSSNLSVSPVNEYIKARHFCDYELGNSGFFLNRSVMEALYEPDTARLDHFMSLYSHGQRVPDPQSGTQH